MTWSGYAKDPRELWEIDEVVATATALVYASPWVLKLLVDEYHPDLVKLCPDDSMRAAMFPGRLGLASFVDPIHRKVWRKSAGGIQHNHAIVKSAVEMIFETGGPYGRSTEVPIVTN